MADLKPTNYETPKIGSGSKGKIETKGVIPIFVLGVVYVAGVTLLAAAVGGAISVQLAVYNANFVKK